jgi:endonuclease-3
MSFTMPAPLALRRRTATILALLTRTYPQARCSLTYRTPLELLVATILSAQCTDVLVNQVTPKLFAKYPTARDYATARRTALERDLSRVNFFRNKAKSIQLACQTLVEQFGGQVPDQMEALLTLHGVARKTANVVLGNAFNKQEGVVVDTHVMRLTQRMGLTKQTDRNKIEQDLMTLVPRPQWTQFGHLMIAHGRAICKAPTPRCADCPLGKTLCPSYRTLSASSTPRLNRAGSARILPTPSGSARRARAAH